MPHAPRAVAVALCLALCSLFVSLAGAQTGAQTCDSVKVECCALKPQYGDPAFAGFTGTIAAATFWSPNLNGPDSGVLTVVDFQNQGAAPLGNAGPWLTPFYNGPGNSWNKGNLGTVFGLTIDDQGNIYLASSSCYNNDYFPGNLAGRIWKINATTGAFSQFNNLPNFADPSVSPGQNLPGLGNISFDCDHRQIFVTNEEDGKIYRLSMTPNAAPLSTFDPGAPDNGQPGWAPLGERLWAVQYHANRVYYSVWAEDEGRPSATAANQIWSVALNGSGDFIAGSQQLELNVPPWQGNWSNPVSDISFGPAGQMLFAERCMINDTQPNAHHSRLLEYICAVDPASGAKQWIPSGNLYGVGVFDVPPGQAPSSAGGCDYDLGVGNRVWVTGDALEFGPDYVYGLQGLPNTGGDYTNSINFDDNNQYAYQDKTEIGDIEISCQTHPQQPSEMCGIKFLDNNGDGIMNGADTGLSGWTIVANGPGGPYTTVTGPGGFYCLQNLPPGTYSVHEVPQSGFTQTAPPTVSYTMTLPPGTGGLNFGNYHNCDNPSTVQCLGGRVDNFNQSDGPEPATPDPALLALIQGCSPGSAPVTQFDVMPCKQCFGHTFQKCWSDSCVVIGARFQIHLHAGDCGASDDSLCFMVGGVRVWCMDLSTLQNLATGGTDVTWSAGDDNTFNLDLANLPPDANGVTNILAALQNGQLGVLIRDATAVDYMRLVLQVCCPNGCIMGSKFLDSNHNGIQDAGEPALGGWTITLTGPVNASTTTAADGSWSFCNLPAGNYVVHESNVPNWINTTPPGGTFTVNLNGGATVSGLVFGNWPCSDQRPCVKAPNGMTAWWPLDEFTGPTADDIALNNVGTWIGSPVSIPGVVGNALRLPTANDFVRVPHHPSINFGVTDFSIDAWVRFQQPSTGIRTIVDKRGGTSSNPIGYQLFTLGDHLGFQLGDGGPVTNFVSPGPTLADGNWHHVAMTVHRPSPTGGRLYVDGVVVMNFNPTVRPGSVANGSPLFIGSQTVSPSFGLLGDVDEVEIFGRQLDSLSVRAIWAAGPRGKCKLTASLPQHQAYCINQNVLASQLTICNLTGTPQTVTWSLAGLPVSPPQCTVPGPTVFTPASGTVNVPANGCVNIPFTVVRPAGLIPGKIACYQATILNPKTGDCISTTGSLTAIDKWCLRVVDTNPIVVGISGGTVGGGASLQASNLLIEWNISKPLGQSLNLPYRVSVWGDDGLPDLDGISLNRLPPGEPYIGDLSIVGPDDTFEHLLSIQAMTTEKAFGTYHILLEADLDGDGQFDPVASQLVEVVLPEQLPTSVPPPTLTGRLSEVHVQPNPFTSGTDLSFTLGRSGPVTVRIYDLLGRLVATLQDGAMSAGLHTLPWDGRDMHGNLVGHGIYMVRVRSGDDVETAKMVRMN